LVGMADEGILITDCAYTTSWKEVLQHAVEVNGHLFVRKELAILRQLLALDFFSLRLVARLMMRRGDWFKTDDLHVYMKLYESRSFKSTNQDDDDNDPGDTLQSASSTSSSSSVPQSESLCRSRLQAALTTLFQQQLLETINESASFELSWSAAESLFTMDDWQQFQKSALPLKLAKASSKEETLKVFKKALFSQKTCFGPTLSQRFVPALLRYWTAQGLAKNETFVSPPIRIEPSCQLLLRRCVRLFQVQIGCWCACSVFWAVSNEILWSIDYVQCTQWINALFHYITHYSVGPIVDEV
jgi:hypothetical protein